MTKKRHRIRNKLKSFFDKDTDLEDHEKLQETRKDMEEKKKILLNLVGTNEENNESKKGPVTELIEDFHKQYEKLFAQYDHLTGKLKEKINKPQQETQKFSSSSDSNSDSDSDHSSKGNGSKNGKLGNAMYTNSDEKTSVESEYNSVVSSLQEKLETAEKEVKALQIQEREMKLELERKDEGIAEYKMQIEGLHEKLTSSDALLKQLFEEKEYMASKLKDHDLEMETLNSHKTGLENEASSKITALTTENSELKLELEAIQMVKIQLEEQSEKEKQELLETLNMLETENAELKVKIEDQVGKIKELEDELISRNELCERLETRAQESVAEMQEAESRIIELRENLSISSESKDERILELEVLVEDLKRDLEAAVDEEKTAWEKTRAIEVQLLLANQKLRITEQQLSEKEEVFKIAEMKYQEECEVLEDRATRLSQVLAANNEAYRGMIMDMSETFNKLLGEMESIMMKFEDEYERFSENSSNLSEEVSILKDCAVRQKFEREQLREQVISLSEKLRNERELGEMMRANIGKLEKEYDTEKGENENLVLAVSELKKLKADMEVALKERDERLMVLGEEKLQAIRQLCLWCDDVWVRYDQLKKTALKPKVHQRE